MQNRAMLEQQVTYAVNVTHLHIRASQEIALLVTPRNSHSYICLEAGELVSLRGYYAHYVALLTLDAKLADRSGQVSLLVRCHG